MQNETAFPVESIQVSGDLCFEGGRWREAILYYLFGSWSENPKVMYRPKVNFGDVTLRLDPEAGEYLAYGTKSAVDDAPVLYAGAVQTVGRKRTQVEQGLIRFVKNNRIRFLVIELGRGRLMLWKGEKRGELRLYSFGLPTHEEFFGTV